MFSFVACGTSDEVAPLATNDSGLGASDSASLINDDAGTNDGTPDSSLTDSGTDGSVAPTSCGTFNTDAGAGLTFHSVAPKTTDAAITATWNAPHIAYLSPSGVHRCSLVVFLSGVGGNPSSPNLFLLHPAARGFHGLDLEYANTISPSPTCETSADTNCHLKLRQEELEGGNLSPLLVVSVADGIENRIAKALTYLDKTFPSEGWGTFVKDPGTPLWSSIIISGHSHGASTAGVIGTLRNVSRVLILAGPYDFRGTTTKTPAPWLSLTSTTPKSSFFAFSHTADTQTPQDMLNWDAAKIPTVGTRANVDSTKAPYGGTHQLVSSFAGGGHGSPISNTAYVSAWDTMLGL